jgi:hypothetical protein
LLHVDALIPNVCLPTPSLPSPAPEILDYLARQPGAQDTIEGILHWWVLDACIRNWTPKIAETVAQLVELGFLEKKPRSGGKIFYHVSPRYLSTLQQRPPLSCTPDDNE